MDALWDIAASLIRPFAFLFNIMDQRNVFSLIGAAIFVFLSVVVTRVRRNPRATIRLRAFFRFLFASRVWLHRSSLLDYKLYIANSLFMAFALSLFVVGSSFWVGLIGPRLATVFGAPPAGDPGWIVFLFVTLCQLLAFDFGYWLAHYGFHRSEVIWEFHKVHHSAEVMTPATEFRQHPVEIVAFPIVFGFTTGVTFAVMAQIFGPDAHRWGLAGQNLILIAHMLSFHHLRHSHVNLPFTGALGVIFHSPAHHRIHHSDNPAHFDRNMGYLLSIWDWMAGTLHMPRKGETVTLGIGHEGRMHDGVTNSFWLPCKLAWRRLSGRRSPANPAGNGDRGQQAAISPREPA
jgi:sterol desaturase/sphingolipid hydroxylase (fatty acid hydroxylase superfamily)